MELTPRERLCIGCKSYKQSVGASIFHANPELELDLRDGYCLKNLIKCIPNDINAHDFKAPHDCPLILEHMLIDEA